MHLRLFRSGQNPAVTGRCLGAEYVVNIAEFCE